MLSAYRFEKNDTSSNILESFDDAESMGVRWSLPGGVQRMELTVKSKSRYDMMKRLDTHSGQRIAFYSPKASRPISGYIYSISPVGAGRVQYVCYGGWRRLRDVWDATVYDPTDTSGDVVTTALTDHCSFCSDGSIATSGAAIGGWQPSDEIGDRLQDVIIDMTEISDSSYYLYDFWFVDQQIKNGKLRQLSPQFQRRAEATAINWQCDVDDMASLDLSRGIADSYSNITVLYDTVGGSATGGSSTTLVDSGGSFTTDGIVEGDRVANEDDGSFARVETIDSDTQLTISALSGGSANTFTSGDAYSITMQDLQSVTASAGAVGQIWIKYWREIKRGFNETQATNYANMLLQQKNRFKQQMPFAITAPYIFDGSGVKWPLFEAIASGGGHIRINDLYPTTSLYAENYNDASAFFITSMDYDGVANQMRFSVDERDSRLDARLVTAGILGSEMVGR